MTGGEGEAKYRKTKSEKKNESTPGEEKNVAYTAGKEEKTKLFTG